MTLLSPEQLRRTSAGSSVAEPSDAVALIDGERRLSHADLRSAVNARAAALGSTRRLIFLEFTRSVEAVLTFLAARQGGHPVLLLPPATTEALHRDQAGLISRYQPDLLIDRDHTWHWTDPDQAAAPPRHPRLHPDLAVLLGTSGSTGTPKLVRLSTTNLETNADAIARGLGLDARSRAATTLPLHYCYGLSVLTSHLAVGGSVWLSDLSVTAPEFWDGVIENEVTTLAGVPHTFELLERSRPDWAATPGLRLVTQAGGALAPDAVRRISAACRRHAVDFVVMYGQTEATARMAMLPPALAAQHPGSIGRPIDGGSFRLDDGELVYRGPNVMMGYATGPEDLTRPAELTELRTGDLARQNDAGLWEITGRCNRIGKVFGVRVDLDAAERSCPGRAALLVAHDRLFAFTESTSTGREQLTQALATYCHLPEHAVTVRVLPALPRTPSGKVDYPALHDLLTPPVAVGLPDTNSVQATYAAVFGRPVAVTDSFSSLGGDSLSYVETYVRLERLLGSVPHNWPQMSIAALEQTVRRPARRWVRMETPMVLRAAAIMLIVGSHVELWTILGGAHTLLALFGYNLARFALSRPTAATRMKAVARAVADMAVPAALWIALVILVQGTYGWQAVFGLTNWLGSPGWSPDWCFWFLEAAIWPALAFGVLLSLAPIQRAYRSRPFEVALGVLAVTMALRFLTEPRLEHAIRIYAVEPTLWCLALGWVIAEARGRRQQLLATALVLACTHGFFETVQRELLVAGCLIALIWVRAIVVPRILSRPIATVAAASLFIYITHWQVYPPLEKDYPLLAWAASLAVGILAQQGWSRLVRRFDGLRWSAQPPGR